MSDFNAKISIDATQAEQGLRTIESGLKRTGSALQRFDGNMAKAFAGLDSRVSDFSRMAREMAALSGAAETAAKAMQTIGRGLSSGRAATGAATAIARLSANLRALNDIRPNQHLATALFQLTNSIQGFKFSSANARNFQAFLRSLESVDAAKIDRVASALARLNNFAPKITASTARNAALLGSGAGSRAGGFALPNFGAATASLQRFGDQLGVTTALVGGLYTVMSGAAIGRFVRGIYDSGIAMLQFDRSIEAVSTSMAEVSQHRQFIDTLTRELPIGLQSAQTTFGKFAVSARLSGESVENVHKIFRGFSTAFAVLKLSTEQQENAFLALEQMFNKGVIQAEELRRQLGQYLPGAFELLATAIGKTPAELGKLMQQGQVSAHEITKLSDLLTEIYGGQVPKALTASRSQMILLGNEFTRFQQQIFAGGFDRGLSAMFNQLRTTLAGFGITDAARSIGSAFERMFATIGAAGAVAIQNWEPLSRVVAALGGLAALSGAVAVTRLLVSPLVLLLTMAGSLAGGAVAAARGIAALGSASAVASAGVTTLAVATGTLSAPMLLAASAAVALAAGVAAAIVAASESSSFDDFKNRMLAMPGQLLGAVGSAFESLGNKLGAAMMPKGVIEEFEAAQKRIETQIDASRRTMDAQDESAFRRNAERERQLQTLKEGTLALTHEQERLLDRMDPIGKANDQYRKQLDILAQLQQRFAKGLPDSLNPAQAADMKFRLDYLTLAQRNPFAAEVRDLTQELGVLRAIGDQRTIEGQLLGIRNKLLREGKVLNDQEADALRNLLRARLDLERGGANGFQRWATAAKDLRESLIDVERNGVDRLSDALADLSVGKAVNFAQIGQDLLRQFNKSLIDDLLRDITGKVKGNSPLAAMFGLSAPNAAGSVANAQALAKAQAETLATRTAAMQVEAGTVIINGGPSSLIQSSSLPNIPGANVAAYGNAANSNFPVSGALGRRLTVADVQRAVGMPDISARSNFQGRMMNPADVQGIVFHHTGGSGNPFGVQNTLNQRGLGVQYVMDRDGNITRLLPEGMSGAHILPSARFPGAANPNLSNANTIGVEMIARNNADVTQAQIDVAKKFYEQQRQLYPNALAYGHGELNPGHKQSDEGMAAVMAIRSQSEQLTASLNSTAAASTAATQNVMAFGEGLNGLKQPLGALFPMLGIGGPAGAIGGGLVGMFRQGGMSNAPVEMARASAAAFHGAPSYASGTPNTGRAHPAFLHDNEAVIPLTRGREVPVRMESSRAPATAAPPITVIMQGVKDFDSFRRSKSQFKNQMISTAMLANQRNG